MSAEVFRYRLYQWSGASPGPGWRLVVEIDNGRWVNRLWAHD